MTIEQFYNKWRMALPDPTSEPSWGAMDTDRRLAWAILHEATLLEGISHGNERYNEGYEAGRSSGHAAGHADAMDGTAGLP